MFYALIALFALGLVLLVLATQSAGKKQYGYSFQYALFAIIIFAVGVALLVFSRQTEHEILCEEKGGIYIEDICYDFRLGPILPIEPPIEN